MGEKPKPIAEETPPAPPPPAETEQPPAEKPAEKPAVEKADEQYLPDPDYTKAELEAAQAEIDLLDPKQWLAIVAQIRKLEGIAKTNMTEAPGIAWTNLYGPHGGQINVTSRDITPELAYDGLMTAVAHAMRDKKLQWSPVKQFPASAQASTPANQAPSSDLSEKLKVESVTHQLSKNQKHYVLVKTVDPRYNQYGVNAWPEVVPEDNFESWDVGQPYQPPDSMKFATVTKYMKDGNERKKVTAFHSS